MKTIDELVAILLETATEIMHEPEQPADIANRADRLEISTRCLVSCAVLKELSFQQLEEIVKRYAPNDLTSLENEIHFAAAGSKEVSKPGIHNPAATFFAKSQIPVDIHTSQP